jgi:hypothetical protein
MAVEEGDEETVASVVADVDGYQEQVEGLEFRRMFSGEMDANNAFLDIHSLILLTTFSTNPRSLPKACASAGLFHISGLSNSFKTSVKRSLLTSKSKIPPKRTSPLT